MRSIVVKGARSPAFWVLGTALVLASLRWVDPRTWSVVDLVDFLRGGQSVLEGTDLYGHYPGVLPFNYPPFAALVFVPLQHMGLSAATAVVTCVSLISIVVIAHTSTREALPTVRHPRAWTAALVVLSLAMEPVQRTLVFGQVNLALAALVIADVFLVPPRFRGSLIAVAAGIKLVPVVFLGYYVMKRDWHSVIRAAAAGSLTIAAGWLFLPGASAAYWLGGFDKVARFGDVAAGPGNQSVRAALGRVLPPQDLSLAVLVVSALSLALACVAALRVLRGGDDLAALTCLGFGGLLASPISWTHHWVWVLPMVVVLAVRGFRVAVAGVVAAMFLPPMWLLLADGSAHWPQPFVAVVASAYTLLGLGCLALLAAQRQPRALCAISVSAERDLELVGAR